MANSRDEILKKSRDKVNSGEPIIGGGAGTGISAKCEEAGGIDLTVIYNTGHDMDLLTTPYVFNEDEAKAMADARNKRILRGDQHGTPASRTRDHGAGP